MSATGIYHCVAPDCAQRGVDVRRPFVDVDLWEFFLSLRAEGQRYRIIYRVEGDKVVVMIVAVGIREEGDRGDIYALAQKLVRLGLLR